ncbi:MAG: ABC transporter ATP-binding protein [Propionicimonas sp.]
MTEPSRTPILEVDDLSTHFATDDGMVTAVDRVSLSLAPGETLGLVGESGCGKSVTARSILRLLDERSTHHEGRVMFQGVDLLRVPERKMQQYRGGAISMIFQDPMTSLDPVFTIGSQLTESLRIHRRMTRGQARDEAAALLSQMGIPDAGRRLSDYPHQLSGGMRQRVMIAIAVAAHPGVLIADEPTTALDVTTQAQILDLMAGLQRELGMAMLFITHDLAVVSEVCSRVAIMYLGRIVEEGPTAEVLRAPKHPYTRGLIASTPSGGTDRRQARLAVIPGRVPSLAQRPDGCHFAPRCPLADQACQVPPELVPVADRRSVRCWHADRTPDRPREAKGA